MFLRAADVLEQRTQTYWRLSSIRTGRLKEKITVGQIIEAVNQIEFTTGPSRKLLPRIKALSDAFIEGKGKRAPKPATIVMLPPRAVIVGV